MEQYTFYFIYAAIIVFVKYLVFLKGKKNADTYLKPFAAHLEMARWTSNFFTGYVQLRGLYQGRMVRVSYGINDQGANFTIASNLRNFQPKKKSWFTLVLQHPALGAGFVLNGKTVFYSTSVKYWSAPRPRDIPKTEWLLNHLVGLCEDQEKRPSNQKAA